ncbi:Membrane protein involved in the export of O-antigen and teichoic acid [Halogranum gelatinilyticum]|uniref:Membrane protein involved in the export of O-antigen and teichoic acid n=1 Tax=Halogranum gelatinilyticum TaxID=660521 RepID=A0A1G9X6L3_9EURY|nr:lipopolysaccharide biosynthesis protein [Halogranum gelatinilyticum]SDM91975.1 Membrane protein involved in the export of O-antigen and teichoic acid [Halogranum gelatinilyticum]
MAKDTSSLSLGRETVIGMVGRVLLLISGFIEVLVLTRFLNPSTVGSFYVLLSAAEILCQVIDGTGVAIRKRVSEIGSSSSEYLGAGILFAITYSLLLGAIVGLVYWCTSGPLFGLTVSDSFGVIVTTLTLGLFSIAFDTYTGTGNPGAATIANAGRSLIRLLAVVGILSLTTMVPMLIWAVACANFLAFLLILFLLDIHPTLPSRETAYRTLSFARYSVPNKFLQRLYSRADILLLSALAGNAAAGFYEAALRLTIPSVTAAVVLARTLSVKTSGLASRAKEGVERELQQGTRFAGLFGFPLLAGSIVLGQDLLAVLYTPEYVRAWPALVGLALFQLIYTYRLQYTNVVDGLNQPEINFRVNVGIVIIFLPTATALTLTHGLIGILVATVSTEILRLGAYVYILRKDLGFPFEPMIVMQIISAAIMFLFLPFLSLQLVYGKLYNTTILILFGGLIYFSLLLILDSEIRFKMKKLIQEHR